MSVDWAGYFEASRDKPLHPLWKEIDPHLPPGGVAIDLGCGIGLGTVHLVERGFQVIAVDQEPEALAQTRARLPEGADVNLLKVQFRDLALDSESLDVAVAFFSLFFLISAELQEVLPGVIRALRPGGLFAGQLLGVSDDWASRGYSVHTREEVEQMLSGFDVLYLEEAERDGQTLQGEPKHWHVFHIVARKK